MALASGLAAQLGLKEETTYGTAVTVDTFGEFVSESIKFDRSRIESAGLRAGRRVLHRWAQGSQRAAGDLELELPNVGVIGWLLKHAFGGVATTGSGPYVHTFTPGDLAGKGLTVQIGRPDMGGTVRAFTYNGAKVTSWSIAASVDEYVKATFSLYALAEATGTALATASYPAGLAPFVFTGAQLDIAGSGIAVKDITLSGDNTLATDRHRQRASDPEQSLEPLESNLREYAGSLSADFEDLTAYTRFTAGTEAALVATFTSGSDTLVVTTNVRFDGETPVVGGPDLLEQPLSFKCLSGTSDAAAITAVLTNTDATY